MELNKIYNEDCLEGMKRIPDKSIDLVIIDPPYLMKQGKGGGAFGREKRSYHNEIESMTNDFEIKVLDELVRVMKKINLYVWCSKDQLQGYINYFSQKGCTLDLLTWHKTNPVPTCNGKYLSDTEYLLFFKEKGVKVFGSYSTKKKFYVTPTNKKDKDLYQHPTVKPLNIIENLVINSSQENELVLDCFIGSGTTAVAAINTGRHFIGFEKEKEYFDVAIGRIKKASEEDDSKV